MLAADERGNDYTTRYLTVLFFCLFFSSYAFIVMRSSSANRLNLAPENDSFTSSFNPTLPTSPRSRRSRSPRSHTGNPAPARVTHRIPHVLRSLFTPRVLSPLLLWSLLVYLVHNFLIPLPVPGLSLKSAKPAADEYFLSTSFPPPPSRRGDDSLDSVDPRYRPHRPLDPPEAPFPRLRPTRFLPPRCMEQWFADGETTCGSIELGPEEQLDATWLWVNGTDPRWRESLIEARNKAGVYSPEHHFR